MEEKCDVCGLTISENIAPSIPCSNCGLVTYCSEYCRQRHEHDTSCSEFQMCAGLWKQAKDNLDRAKGRPAPPSDPDPTWINRDVHFSWLDYLHRTTNYIDSLIEIDTVLSNTRAIETSVWLLENDSRGQQKELADIIPYLYLKLGRDLECYKFICWYADHSVFESTDLLLHLTPQPDILESVDNLCNRHVPLSHQVAAMLVKMKLLFDVKQNMKNFSTFRDGQLLPTEIIDEIEVALVRSILGPTWEPGHGNRRYRILWNQIDALWAIIYDRDEEFWGMLDQPSENFGNVYPWFWPMRRICWGITGCCGLLLYLWHTKKAMRYRLHAQRIEEIFEETG